MRKIERRPFNEAREYAIGLGLKSRAEWKIRVKQGEHPEDILASPEAYSDWKGWGDFLGTGNVASRNKTFRAFNEAREYARELDLNGFHEWNQWCNTGDRPGDIPSSPRGVYRNEWTGWGDFLGTGNPAPRSHVWRPFDEARELVRGLGLKSFVNWRAWLNSGNCPVDIPRSPRSVYRDEWKGFRDFLQRPWRLFGEAREYTRSLGLRTQREWKSWAKGEDCPNDIPFSVESVYSDDWEGWGDFLGTTNKWTVVLLQGLLQQWLDDELIESLSPSQLLAIINADKVITSNHGKKFADELISAVAGQDPAALQQIIDGLNDGDSDGDEDSPSGIDRDIADQTSEDYIDGEDGDEEEPELPSVRVRNLLRGLGSSAINTNNEQTTKFLIKSSVGQLWNCTFADEAETVAAVHACGTTGEKRQQSTSAIRLALSDQVRNEFLKEYESIKALKLPAGYKSEIVPNLMQWLIADRVKRDRRVGNWSGIGAGKTLSAVLASGVVRAKFTVVVCPNNTIDGWRKEISRAFPQCEVQTKTFSPEWGRPTGRRYLILNHELFQQAYTSDQIDGLLESATPDLVVIDEVQAVKQRYKDEISLRKRMMDKFIQDSTAVNPSLRVLGMSATPVINNLHEAKSLIELVLGEERPDIPVQSTLMNAHVVHQHLSMLGIRYKPNFDMVETVTPVPVDCTSSLDLLYEEKTHHKIELVLAPYRVSEAMKLIKPKTLIYTNTKEGLVKPMLAALRAAGWKAGEYSGDDHSGLTKFIDGELDVLIGTNAIATGTDGLQEVCSRLVILTLPWTGALYEQIRGRVYRQDQLAKTVNVFVLSAFADAENGRWEWDEMKRRVLKYKNDLASAAVDGEVADKQLITPAKVTLAARRLLMHLRGESARELGVCTYCLTKKPNFDGFCNTCRPERLQRLDYRSEYLSSEWWRHVRKRELERAGHHCTVCSTSKRLVIHHKRYKDKKGRSILGREPTSALQVLCWDCHGKTHNEKGAPDDRDLVPLNQKKGKKKRGRKSA